jgi:hypothetical protein
MMHAAAWPDELNALVTGVCHDPHAFLGLHRIETPVTRAFSSSGQAAACIIAGSNPQRVKGDG